MEAKELTFDTVFDPSDELIKPVWQGLDQYNRSRLGLGVAVNDL